MNKTIRHGDVSLHEVEKIEGKLVAQKEFTLAYGEVTGHSHKLKGDVKIYQDTFGNTYIQVGEKGASVTHEEHRKVTLKKGNYKMFNEREFNYFENAIKKVID